MHSAPNRPTRVNWIWFPAAAVAFILLSVAVLNHGGGDCQPAALGAPADAGVPGQAGEGGAGDPGGQPTDPTAPTAGLALFYDPGTATGSCSLGPFSASGFYASLPARQYDKGAACGTYLDVRGPRGKVRVEVVDLCPGCSATTINLSRAAFDRVADPGPGSAHVTYRRAVNPRLPGTIGVQVTSDPASSQIEVQILNHGNALTSVAIAERAPATTPGGRDSAHGRLIWHPLTLGPNGYWRPATSLGAGPFELRITDGFGHQAVLAHLALYPGMSLKSHRWMYRAQPPVSRTGQPASQPARVATSQPAGPHC